MKNRIRGSFTVEAALVFPIVLFVIVAVICLTFYLHDRCRIQNVTDLVLHKAAFTVKHDADFETGKTDYDNINKRGVLYFLQGNMKKEEDAIEAYLWDKLKGGLLLTEVTQIDVTADAFSVNIMIVGSFHLPFPAVLDYFNPKFMKIKTGSPVHNPAETIRIAEVILDTGGKIKGVDKLKEKLEKIIK